MFLFSQKGHIQKTVLDNDKVFLNVPEDYENDEQCLRQSQDSGTMNARGRNLLETCTALNLRILNGRIVGDLGGKKTCFHYNGSSVVDYVIGSKGILRNVRYLIVNKLMPHLSDHCHLSLAIKATFVNRDSFERSAELILTEYNKLFWNVKSKNRLKDGLKSQTVQSRLETAVKHDSIDTASELLSETLAEACREAGLKVRGDKIKCKSQKKWFDQECKTEKENLISLGEKISHNTNNSEMGELLRVKKKKFKQTCRRNKREYISEGLSNIDMQNSKETWRQIGKIFNLGKRKTHGAETVSTEQFYEYFKQQNAAPLNNMLDLEMNMETQSNERVEGPLDIQ